MSRFWAARLGSMTLGLLALTCAEAGSALSIQHSGIVLGSWPQFRGPNGSGVSAETGVPTEWDQTKNIRWKAELPGRGVSCPVVADDRAFVTSSSGFNQDRLHVLCIDTATGKHLWERQFWATGSTLCHPKTAMAAPTPVTDGQRVFALFACGDVVALDRDGNVLWVRSLARDYPPITNNVGMAASPVLWKETLLLPMENPGTSLALALDARTGQNRWKVDRLRDINWVTPVVIERGGKAEVLFQTKEEITAYDVETGAKAWEYKGGLSPVASPFATPEGLVLVAGNDFYGLKPKSGKEPELVWKSTKLKTNYTSAVFHQNRVYGVNNANILNGIDAATGEQVSQLRLKGPFWASPLIAEGRLYITNEKGVTSVVQLSNEPTILSTNDIGEDVTATPAIAEGAIFIRTDGHLWCISSKKQ
jgi:outer membrane protein assembly factor BamB